MTDSDRAEAEFASQTREVDLPNLHERGDIVAMRHIDDYYWCALISWQTRDFSDVPWVHDRTDWTCFHMQMEPHDEDGISSTGLIPREKKRLMDEGLWLDRES